MAADILEMSLNLVAAHLTQNRMSAHNVPEFIRNIYTTLQDLKGAPAQTWPTNGAIVAVPQARS